jgi:ribosome-binding protein aMBF1 (putative translation factor)
VRVRSRPPAQIRAARALLRWSAAELAEAAALGANTVRRAEAADDQTSLTAANELAVRRALEAAGVEFIDENGSGAGMRLRKCQETSLENRSPASKARPALPIA